MPVASKLASPISAIPVEVLCAIFAVDQPRLHEHTSYPAWIAQTTWVCRRWRSAALECSSLWTFATTDLGYPWLAEILFRSRKAPLTLLMDLQDPFCSPANIHFYAQILASQAHRLKEVVLTADSDTLSALCSSLCLPAPLLERFQLLCSADDSLIPQLPDMLFDSPNLREVAVDSCMLPHNPSWLSGLSSLSLGWTSQNADRLSCKDVLRVLGTVPHLTYLSLDHCIYETFPDYNTPLVDGPIPLPLLEKFDLLGDCLESSRLLSNLQLPTSCSLTLFLSFTGEDDVRDIGEALQSCWSLGNSSGAPPLKTMLVEQFEGTQIHLSCWPGIVDMHAVQNTAPFFGLTLFSGAEGRRDPEQFRNAFLSTFPLKQLQRIYDGRPSARTHGLDLKFPAFGSMQNGFTPSTLAAAGPPHL